MLAADITADGVTAQLAQNAGTAIFIKDAQGTVTDVTDSAGTKIMHYVYTAFGELIGIKDAYGADVTDAPPVSTSYGFTGREKDNESGMLYYRARYYMPEIGRMLQKDPDPGKLNITASVINAYAYVMNNPINLLDPTGRGWFGLGFIGALVAIIAFPISATVGAVMLGVTGALAAVEALKYHGDTQKMYKQEGLLGVLGIAAIGGISAWTGFTLASQIFPAGNGVWYALGNGALSGAIGSGLNQSFLQGFDIIHTSSPGEFFSNIGGAMIGGAIVGGVCGSGGYYFHQPISGVIGGVSEGTYYFGWTYMPGKMEPASQ